MKRFEIIQDSLAIILSLTPDSVTEQATPSSLGADSLDTVEIIMALEEAFDLEFTTAETDLLMSTTVGQMLKLLEEWLGPEEPTDGLLTLTDEQFIRRYEPETTPQGDYYRQREWCDQQDVPDIKAAIGENRCWTMVDDDNGMPCIVWGNRVVNRIYNIITRRPIENPEWEVQVPDDSDPSDWDDHEDED